MIIVGWVGSTSHYAESETAPETLCGIEMRTAMGGWIFGSWDIYTFATEAECRVCREKEASP